MRKYGPSPSGSSRRWRAAARAEKIRGIRKRHKRQKGRSAQCLILPFLLVSALPFHSFLYAVAIGITWRVPKETEGIGLDGFLPKGAGSIRQLSVKSVKPAPFALQSGAEIGIGSRRGYLSYFPSYFPPTPPDKRARIRRFGELRLAPRETLKSETIEIRKW